MRKTKKIMNNSEKNDELRKKLRAHLTKKIYQTLENVKGEFAENLTSQEIISSIGDALYCCCYSYIVSIMDPELSDEEFKNKFKELYELTFPYNEEIVDFYNSKRRQNEK